MRARGKNTHHQIKSPPRKRVHEFGKKKFLLVNHNTHINTEDRQRETRLKGNFRKRATLRVTSSSFSKEYCEWEWEREFSFSFTHIGRLDHNPKLRLSPSSLCFVLEKQREKVREKENAKRWSKRANALKCTLRARMREREFNLRRRAVLASSFFFST